MMHARQQLFEVLNILKGSNRIVMGNYILEGIIRLTGVSLDRFGQFLLISSAEFFYLLSIL